MVIARRAGALLLVLGALTVWFGMTPDSDSDPDHRADVAAIESEDDSNNAMADGAPQQTVVNGWTAINYQRLLSEQMDEASSSQVRDDRPTAMLGLCVAGIALIAFTARDGARSTQPRASGPSVPEVA
jgi:hypothetical protein